MTIIDKKTVKYMIYLNHVTLLKDEIFRKYKRRIYMAKMIPLELKNGEYLSNSEKEVFEILKEGLSDEWIVIYSLRWITDDDIFLGKSNGESDFILIHQDFGVMVLEVKGELLAVLMESGQVYRQIIEKEL